MFFSQKKNRKKKIINAFGLNYYINRFSIRWLAINFFSILERAD